MAHKYYGWLRQWFNDTWNCAAASHDYFDCWNKLHEDLRSCCVQVSMVVLPVGETPTCVKRGRKRND